MFAFGLERFGDCGPGRRQKAVRVRWGELSQEIAVLAYEFGQRSRYRGRLSVQVPCQDALELAIFADESIEPLSQVAGPRVEILPDHTAYSASETRCVLRQRSPQAGHQPLALYPNTCHIHHSTGLT